MKKTLIKLSIVTFILFGCTSSFDAPKLCIPLMWEPVKKSGKDLVT